MAASRSRVSRFLTDSRPQPHQVLHSPADFYREELLRCQRCLDAQREFYSEHAICEVEKVLTRLMAQLDRLCTQSDAEAVVSKLLQQFDTIASLSAWSDPRHIH
jgi:hypothetical protein